MVPEVYHIIKLYLGKVMEQHHIKAGVTIMLLLFITNILLGQNKIKSNFFEKDQIIFTISPVLYDNLDIGYWGEKILKSKVTFSGEATILYHKNIKNNFAINIGIGLGLVPYNIHYFFKAPSNSIFQTGPYKKFYEYLDDNHYDYVQFIWVLPLSAQKIIKYNKNNYYNLEGGIKLNRVIAYPYEITTDNIYVIDDTTEALLFSSYLTDTQKYILSYFFNVGIGHITKKRNIFQINAVLHFSFTKIGIGYYEFQNLPYESKGQIGWNINYIGLEFVYGLSLFKDNKTRD
jgi:hypothetical protein